MDRISDSDSEDAGSIPAGATNCEITRKPAILNRCLLSENQRIAKYFLSFGFVEFR